MAKEASKWVIVAHFGIYKNLETDFPAVYKHLLQFEDRLRQRGQCRYTRGGNAATGQDFQGQHHWLELDNNPRTEYLALFSKEKLMWIELAENGRFAYDNSDILGEATTFIMTGKSLRYLMAFLNSRLTRWYLGHAAPTSGMGTTRWKKVYVEAIPIPRLSKEEQRPLVERVDRILSARRVNPDADVAPLESEIDKLVYGLYGLTGEEIKATEQ